MHVWVVVVRAIVGAVERSGASRDQFLQQARIDPGGLEDASSRLPAADYERALEAAITVTGDPAFGLHMGEQLRSVMFDVMGPLFEQAATLREMFASIGHYAPLVSAGRVPALQEGDSSAWIRLPLPDSDSAASRVTSEFVMTALLPVLKMFVGDKARPNLVSFAHEAPQYAAEYTRIFGGAERFGQNVTQMEVPRAWLDKPQPFRRPEFYAVLKAEADRTLNRLEREASLSVRIEQAMAQRGPRQSTVDEIARSLGMSTRSLRRKLQGEGVSYATLRTQHRSKEAKRMLEQPHTSIQETAYALGFDSLTAFYRAFKRWTGMTPKQYRDRF